MALKKNFPYVVQDTRCPSPSERKQFLTKNGSILYQKLIATFGARYKLPIRFLTYKEVIKATNNFAKVASQNVFLGPFMFDLIKGCFQDRAILVAKVRQHHYYPRHPDRIIHNIVISSQMSHLNHVLKLVGCCMEFEFPLLVYEDINVTVLDDFLKKPANDTSLSWRSRLKIIKDIAYTMAYLHNAFPTPIIHQKLDKFSVFIDQFGVPKFLDFSDCLPLPPGKMKIQVDRISGNLGFIDPDFQETFTVTPKTDVYSIGILLLVLVTGQQAIVESGDGAKSNHVVEYVNDFLMSNQVSQVVACEIWESEDRVEKLEQLKALVELALRCTQKKGEDRPYMIDVAKKLHEIEKM